MKKISMRIGHLWFDLICSLPGILSGEHALCMALGKFTMTGRLR